MPSSGALVCRFALRLASPRRLAAAAPSEDIPRLTVEVCRSTHPEQMRQLAVARVRMLRLDALVFSLCARTSRGRTKVDADFRGACGFAGVACDDAARSAARSYELSEKEGEGVLAGDDPRATIGAPTPSKRD
jgi:hypothetical protein